MSGFARTYMMELLMSSLKPTGPLEEARENLECFADSLIQQHMLRAIVDAYVTQQVIAIVMGDEIEDDQLQTLWTKIADDLKERGASA
jgi:hypothetical protein